MVMRTLIGHRGLSKMVMDASSYIKRRLRQVSVDCAISVMDDRMTYQDTIERVIDIGTPRYKTKAHDDCNHLEAQFFQ
jgi:hypothetical protein